jgi:two-component system, chemotaxis family, chemotaxis protein CheY
MRRVRGRAGVLRGKPFKVAQPNTTRQTTPSGAGRAQARRVLVCARGETGRALVARLAEAGFVASLAEPREAPHAAREFAPDAAIVEVGRAPRDDDKLSPEDDERPAPRHAKITSRDDDGHASQNDEGLASRNDGGLSSHDDEGLALARRLRSDEATRSLPLVILPRVWTDGLRFAALELGADDCLAAEAPHAELLARLEALFWRVEAGRTAAAAHAERAARERRAEIDDFLRLLDAAREQVEAGRPCALALLAPSRAGDAHAAESAPAPPERKTADGRTTRDETVARDETVGREAASGGAGDGGARAAGDLRRAGAGVRAADDAERVADDAERVADDAGRASGDGLAARESDALKAAHEFLRRNLRRADAVAFYGPTLLAAHLPRTRARDAAEDLARLCREFRAEHPHAPVAFGLASFPEDGPEVETLIERAEAALASALASPPGSTDARDAAESPAARPVAADESVAAETADTTVSRDARRDETPAEVSAASESFATSEISVASEVSPASESFAEQAGRDERDAEADGYARDDGDEGADADGRDGGDEAVEIVDRSSGEIVDRIVGESGDRIVGEMREDGGGVQEWRGPEQEFLPLPTEADPSGGWRAPAQQPGEAEGQQPHAGAKRGLPPDFDRRRALRESRQRDDVEAAVQPSYAGGGAGGGLARAAAEAAERERERRAGGEAMPRRVLLAVSDPARMAQINLLLRSAAYEVRAAFDGKQALDLLRIERADLLVLDYALTGFDGLGVLRRLTERHGGELPLPVLLLLPGADGDALREEASALGAGGFVALPYDPAELLERVRTTGSAR